MAWAHACNYAVFTHDLNMGTMLPLSQAEGPSVLQVRCLNVLPEAKRQRVRILPLQPRNPRSR